MSQLPGGVESSGPSMSAEAAADAGAADDQPYAHYTDEEVAAIADRALALQMGGTPPSSNHASGSSQSSTAPRPLPALSPLERRNVLQWEVAPGHPGDRPPAPGAGPVASSGGGILAARKRMSVYGKPGMQARPSVLQQPAGYPLAAAKEELSSSFEGLHRRSRGTTSLNKSAAADADSSSQAEPARRTDSFEGSEDDEDLEVLPVAPKPLMGAWRLNLLSVLDKQATTWCLIMLTTFVIFQEDVKYALLPPKCDVVIESITLALLIVFLIEIALSSLVRPGFFLSFYFWLDLAATLSLGFEIPALRAAMLGWKGDPYIALNNEELMSLRNAGYNALVAQKAIRAAKMLRLLQMLQLARLLREFETSQRLKKLADAAPNGMSADDLVMARYTFIDSRVGQKLSDLVVKRVIVGILLMLCLIPAFSIETGVYGSETQMGVGGLRMLHDMAVADLAAGSTVNEPDFSAAMQTFNHSMTWSLGTHHVKALLMLDVANVTYVPWPNATRRYLELEAAFFSSWICPNGSITDDSGAGAACGGQQWDSAGVYDIKWHLQVQSFFGICRTIFIVVLLALGAYFIHQDTRHWVLDPVDRIVNRVQEMADDPLANASSLASQPAKPAVPEYAVAVNADDGTQRIYNEDGAARLSAFVVISEEKSFWQRVKDGVNAFLAWCDRMMSAAAYLGLIVTYPARWVVHKMSLPEARRPDEQGQYEIELLENSICKICELLAVGFGDAGAEIISENIKKQGDLNPMMPGRRMVAVFGFCDIRRFTDATEVLQEQVMEFVNTIAHIVHTGVANYGGAANKNIGDAFLLVWKLPKGIRMRDIRAMQGAGVSDNTSSGGDRLLTSSGGNRALTSSGGDRMFTPSLTRGRSQLLAPAALEGDGMVKVERSPPSGALGVLGELTRTLTTKLTAKLTFADESEDGFGTRMFDMSGTKRGLLGVKTLKGMQLTPTDKALLISVVADNALASFVLIQIALNRSPALKRYSLMPALNERMPGFKVQMGFGLHIGWAIEGAIGSEYKIDASYLSPNVNLASRLEAATKQFGVPLLLSQDFACSLSPAVRVRVRQVDRVTVKGSNHPMGLYTYDLDLEAASAVLRRMRQQHYEAAYEAYLAKQQGGRPLGEGVEFAGVPPVAATSGEGDSSATASTSGVAVTVQQQQQRRASRRSVRRPGMPPQPNFIDDTEDINGTDAADATLTCQYGDDWEDNLDLTATWGLTPEFKQAWDEAFQNYLAGQWQEARPVLEWCLNARVTQGGTRVRDGPANVLLTVMAEHNFKAPADWKGFRELTEK